MGILMGLFTFGLCGELVRISPAASRFPLRAMLLLMLLVADQGLAKEVAGWVERVHVDELALQMRAKLDTGAVTSSLNVPDVELFERGGQHYARFAVTNWRGETATVERPVVRVASIKRHFGNKQERPVVRLTICIGEVQRHVEVNLVDRTGFNYQLLIGRTFLSGEFLIDPEQTYLTEPSCSDKPLP